MSEQKPIRSPGRIAASGVTDARAAETPAGARQERAVTSYDVATLAGVSQSAVSRCFTPGASVSKATRARVMLAVKKLGYRPNAIARSLVTQKSRTVALVVANIAYHPEVTASLSRALALRGQSVLLFTLTSEAEAELVVDRIWQNRVDGIISAVHIPAAQVSLLAERRLPLVFLNRVYGDIAVSSVCCDQVAGERLLVDRLLAAGYRRFAIITGPADSIISGERVGEAIKRLHQAGIRTVPVASGAFDYDSGRNAFHTIMAHAQPPPEAVICANDMMAIGAIDAARHDLGLGVPADIAVAGFDGSPQGQWASYSLTTIRQPIDVMSSAAVEMLLARVADPALPPEKRTYAGALVVGRSALA